jgi:hypothetical protein
MRIQLAPDPQNKSMRREVIEQHFIDEVRKAYGDEFRITIEWLEALDPDETGKQRCFICRV